MQGDLLGRTNRAFPPVWLRLTATPDRLDRAPLVEAALATQVPIDISGQPGLWGGYLRGTDAVIACNSDARYENATDENHATDLLQAHLIETLSCLGREYFDFYFLRVRRAVEEYQISGVLRALELARQEGHIRYLGLLSDGSPLATLGVWQFHDAFDVIQLSRNPLETEPFEMLAPLAKERRVGVVTNRPFDLPEAIRRDLSPEMRTEILRGYADRHPVVVPVTSEAEMDWAIAAPAAIPDLAAAIEIQKRVDAFDEEVVLP